MLTQTIVRGNIVEILTTFDDTEGNEVTPTQAVVTISFLNSSGIREADEIDMEQDSDGVWTAFWESHVALPGRVYWSVLAFDPSSADEGYFELSGNPANLAGP